MNAKPTAAFIVVSLLVAPRALAQTEGLKEADRFVKTIQNTSQAVTDARLKTKTALDWYNALVKGDSTDMKGDYKRLQKAEKDMNGQVANARKISGDMDKQAGVYFSARSAEISQIQDVAMRDQAKKRLDDSKQAYDKVKSAFKGAGDALAPFAKDLSDHIKYLGAELTPDAAASLKPQGEELNKKGGTLFTQIDASLTTATNYMSTLKTQ